MTNTYYTPSQIGQRAAKDENRQAEKAAKRAAEIARNRQAVKTYYSTTLKKTVTCPED